MKATTSVRWGQDSTPPSRWKGQHSGDCCPLLFLLYIEPLLGGSTSAGVDTDSAACPQRPHPTPAGAYADDLNCYDDGLRPTRAGTKLNTFASEFSLPINGKTVATAALHRDVHTKLCTVKMPRRVARQLEGQLQIQATPNPSVLETPSATSGCSHHDARLGPTTPGQRPDFAHKLNRRATRTDAPTRSSDSSNGA
jgi:hypothetical protein